MVASSKRLNKKSIRMYDPYEHVTFLGYCSKVPDSTPGIITALAWCGTDRVRKIAQSAIDDLISLSRFPGNHNLSWPNRGWTASENLTGELVFFNVSSNNGNYEVEIVTRILNQAKISSLLSNNRRNESTLSSQAPLQDQNIDVLRDRLNRVNQELSLKNQDLDNINKDIEESLQYIDELEDYAATREAECRNADQRLSETESKIQKLSQHLDFLQAEVNQAESRIGGARTRIAELAPAEDATSAVKVLREKLALLQKQETGLLASIQAGEEAIQANQATLSRLEGLLGEGRQRLWDNIQTVREVLEVGGRPPKARPAPKGREFQDMAHFFSKRLEPALATWHPKASTKDAEVLHLALLGCRGVLVPGAIWSRAYAEALGASCCFSMTAVGATWIDPQKANDVLAQAFQAARQNPQHIFLHHFRGIDRAPMQCWAGGLLDALAGLHDFEPGSDGVGWPRNLRITLSLDADDLSLPFPAGLLQGFGAVPREGLPGTPCVPLGLEEDAFLAAQTWIGWTTAPRTADPVLPRDLGPWTRQGNHEIQILVNAATVLKHPPRLAELIRLEWPMGYASEDADAQGLGPLVDRLTAQDLV